MPRSTLTTDDTSSDDVNSDDDADPTADAVPAVDRPEPEIDRGLPGALDATTLVFVLGVVALGGWRTAVGDPVAWGDVPWLVSQAGTAATGAAVVRWFAGRGDDGDDAASGTGAPDG